MWPPCGCVHAHAQRMGSPTGSKKRSLRTMITLSSDFPAFRRSSLGLHPIADKDSMLCTHIENIHFALTPARRPSGIGQRQRWLLWTHFPRRQRNQSRCTAHHLSILGLVIARVNHRSLFPQIEETEPIVAYLSPPRYLLRLGLCLMSQFGAPF